MVEPALSMEQKLSQLRQNYGAKLGQRIDEIAAKLRSVSAARTDTDRRTALEGVRLLAHKLAGSGETFGFPEVTRISRDMEHAAADLLAGKVAFDIAVADKLYELCGHLRVAGQWGNENVEEESREIAGAASLRLTAEDKKVSVLLMECDSAAAERIGREMEHFGFAVRTVNHPAKLEAELTNNVTDVLVSGISFGDDKTSVLGTLADLRARGVLKVPLLVHTSLDGIGPRLGAVRAGALAYMVKPVDMADLVNELDAVTHRVQEEPFRVLVIDDDESLARHTELVLQGAGMQTMALTDSMLVLDALDDFSPELILLDLYMPKCSGEELAAVIRQRIEYAGIPIVFLSGEADKDKQLSAMELGGDDFLTKPIRPSHLISSVRIRASRFRKLRTFMLRDGMTGLYNHTTTKQLLDTEIARAQRNKAKLAFASLDLDHFKAVNDTYGHAVGDRVIKALARLLRQRLRGIDVIGRMGGEEFAVILPDTGVDEAAEVFEEFRKAFSSIVFHTDSAAFSVTISCGIAGFPQNEGATELSDAADKALYAAKNGGRNRVMKAD